MPEPRPAARAVPWPLVGGLAAGTIAVAGLLAWALTRPAAVQSPPQGPPVAQATGADVEDAPRAPRSTRDIVSRNERSIANIQGKLGSGTGFVAAPGVIATNAHVINQELIANLSSRFPAASGQDRGPFPVRLLYVNVPRDLALLQIDSRLPPLTLARAYNFQRGEDITIIGNPGGLGGAITLENAITRGVLSTEATALGQRWYQLGASVNPGNSGGPVIDSEGRVIGVVTLKAKLEEGHSYCIPVDALTTALEEVADVSMKQRLRVELRHTTRSTFQVFRELGKNYLMVLAQLIVALDAKSKQTSSAEEAMQALAEVSKRSRAFDRLVRADYTTSLQRVLDDPGTDSRVGRDLAALRQLVDRMKSMAENPEGTLGRFASNIVDTKRELEHLDDQLSTSLDIPR